MNRLTPKVPELQESFMKNLVGPLLQAYLSSSLLPGYLNEDAIENGIFEFISNFIGFLIFINIFTTYRRKTTRIFNVP